MKWSRYHQRLWWWHQVVEDLDTLALNLKKLSHNRARNYQAYITARVDSCHRIPRDWQEEQHLAQEEACTVLELVGCKKRAYKITFKNWKNKLVKWQLVWRSMAYQLLSASTGWCCHEHQGGRLLLTLDLGRLCACSTTGEWILACRTMTMFRLDGHLLKTQGSSFSDRPIYKWKSTSQIWGLGSLAKTSSGVEWITHKTHWTPSSWMYPSKVEHFDTKSAEGIYSCSGIIQQWLNPGSRTLVIQCFAILPRVKTEGAERIVRFLECVW